MEFVDNVTAAFEGVDLRSPSGFLLLVVTVLFTALLCRRLVRGAPRYKWPPGPRGWPLLGNASLISPNSGQTNANITRLGKGYHPDVFTLSMFAGKKYLVLNSYAALKEAFITQSNSFSDRPDDWPFLYINDNHKRTGLFLEPFTESWKREKKYLMRTARRFGYATAGAEPAFHREADRLAGLIKDEGGKPFDLFPPLSLCMLNVNFSLIFSTTYEEGDAELARFVELLHGWYLAIFKLWDLEPLLPLLERLGTSARLRHAKASTRELLDFIRLQIERHRATLDPEHPRDMVDACLIDMAKGDPDGDLMSGLTEDKLLWLFFVLLPDQGDTVPGVLLFLMLASVLHPEVQDRVYEEIQDVIGDRQPRLQDKERMPYTEAAVLETLRMDTAFWLLTPHATAGDVDFLGYRLPGGTAVIPNISAAHFDPELWGDPEVFRPERFIKDGKIARPPFFMPYSLGRRSCIGEVHSQKEFFLFYVRLIQRFKFKLPDGDPRPKLEAQWLFVFPEEFRLCAEPRK